MARKRETACERAVDAKLSGEGVGRRRHFFSGGVARLEEAGGGVLSREESRDWGEGLGKDGAWEVGLVYVGFFFPIQFFSFLLSSDEGVGRGFVGAFFSSDFPVFFTA